MRSILHRKEDCTCYLCIMLHEDYDKRRDLEEHHVFGGSNRKLSEFYGLKIYLCHDHHNEQSCPESIHHNKTIRLMVQAYAQKQFEIRHPDLNFREIFGKNYT